MPLSRRIPAGAWVSAGLFLAIGWFYFWTAVPEPHPGLVAKTNQSYYNLLTRGFLHGRLSLDLPADPFLATLKNPSDPVERGNHGLHDASYYHGKYYIYFGVAPVVLLFLPFRLLTGHYIDDSLAVPLFAWAGLLMGILLLRAVWRRYFRTVSFTVFNGCVLALGLANLVPMLLRRTSVWEVPIGCGYACCLTALYALFQAWHSPRRAPWLAAASAAFGLAVASRPTYLLGCSALLLSVLFMWRDETRDGAPALRKRRLLLAAFLPITAIGLALALYNYLRFDSPLDFGFRHLMNGEQVSTERLFSWQFLWYNLRVYALAPATWSPFFPYVGLARLPAPPTGYLAAEDPYGIFPNIPFVLLGLAALRFGRFRRPAGQEKLSVFCASVLLAAAGTGLMTASFGGAINRYMVDFLPALVVLACLGVLEVSARPSSRGWPRALGGTAIGALLAYSVLFNVLASIRHNELFRAEHPAVYRRVAHAGNYPSHAVDRLLGTRYGALELRVIFPEGRTGTVEPLVVTGRDFLSDYLFVHYLAPGLVRFGLEHTSRGSYVGEPVKIKPGAVQVLRIDLGSLYPPPADPYFDGLTPRQALLRQRTLRVTCNGQVVLDRRAQLYDASSRHPTIGSSDGRPSFGAPFSGKIVSVRRLSAPPGGARSGPVRLELTLPAFQRPQSYPLVSTGESGRGDLVYLRCIGANQIAFGYDHWGLGGPITPPITIDPRGVQAVEIDFGALHPEDDASGATKAVPSGPLLIRLNGQKVLDQLAPFYPCDPSTIAIAQNAIQTSTASAMFSGTMVKIEWGALPRSPTP